MHSKLQVVLMFWLILNGTQFGNNSRCFGILQQLIEVTNEMLSVLLVCFEALYESSLKKAVAYSFSVFVVYRPSEG